MLLPIGDAPNPPGYTPWMSWGLIGANVLVYLVYTLPLSGVQVDPFDPAFSGWLEALHERAPELDLRSVQISVTAWDLAVFQFGFRPAEPRLLTLFTSMFMHSGLLHLFGNMLFLWIYGDNVEHRLGRLPALLAYLLTGALATLGYAAVATSPEVPLVGASGAISGLLGLYFVLFPHNTVRILLFLFPVFVRVFDVSARLVLVVYLLWDNLVPMLLSADGTGGGVVAHVAHVGGFLGGLALGGLVRVTGLGLGEGAGRPRPGTPTEERARQLLASARHNLHSGQVPTAYQQLQAAQRLDADPDTARSIRLILDDLSRSRAFQSGARWDRRGRA